jgi:hypothetical protein
MKPDFVELIREHNFHSMMLNQEGVINALQICYEQGKIDGRDEVIEFVSNMTHLSDNINYIIEELKNQKN